MQIVMLDSIVMANGVLRCGAIYDLSEARALKMISKGLAKSIDSSNVERPTVKRRIVTSLPHGDKG